LNVKKLMFFSNRTVTGMIDKKDTLWLGIL